MKPVQSLAAIHDLSGYGRSSLSVIIPILSTMGIQVCSLPTAVLSTHTGGFEGYNFVDLTHTIQASLDHWKSLDLDFDCIYSGFLGSPAQCDLVKSCVKDFKTDKSWVVVDPVMADNGKLYSTMDQTMVHKMRDLVSYADLISPNYTEACLLLGKDYQAEVTDDQLKEDLVRLANLGPEVVIVTSVPEKPKDKYTSVVAYNAPDQRFWKVKCDYIPAYFPGTGDIFTSVVIGSLMSRDSLPMALDRAVQFITAAIRATYGFDYDRRQGVVLEKVLSQLTLPVMVGSYQLF